MNDPVGIHGLPIGWTVRPLGECGKWYGGGTPSKSNSKFWEDGTVPWLSPKDMSQFRVVDTQDKITIEAVEQSATRLVPGPSVAMVMRSGILERTFPVALVDFDTTLNQDMKAIVPNDGVSALWISYALKAFEQELLETCRKSGTTVASMETVRLMNFEIPVPDIFEQEKIVEILEEQLSRLDAALTSVLAAREKAAQFRRSLLKAAITGSLSGDQSSAGALSSDWKLEPLNRCGQWFGGGTPSKSNPKFWDDGTIPWLSPKDMGDFKIRDTQDKITDVAVEQSSTRLVPGPSVAMVMRSGILERKFPVAVVEFDTALNQDMKALVPNDHVSAHWIAYALNAFEFELLDTCRKSGTTVASMETVRLLNFKIPLPDFAQQLKIIEILEEQFARLDSLLAIAEAIERKAAALRRSLLHAAFTGELTKEWREGARV